MFECDTRHVGARGGDGLADQLLQVEVESALDRGTQQTQGRTPQAERIARAGRLLSRRVDARNGVELVCNRERHARARGRQGVARKAGQVLLAQRLGHFGRFVIVQRVVTPHQALQLRELAHHVGEQVALAQRCGTISQRRVAADGRSNRFRQGTHALRLVVLRAELRLEGHALEGIDLRFERVLAIGPVEESSVGQARTHDTLVAGDHL